jgi:FAD/FMN-containing dehydrogenase
MVRTLPAGLVTELTEVVGRGHVLTDPEVTASYVTDWTGRFVGTTPAVVRPATTDEVAGVVGAVRRRGLALSLQGGNTGLVGGSVPLGGEIVVSLTRLADLGPVDEAAGQVTAGAGVTVADLSRRAAAAGWAYGVDLASRDSATVGGTVATNAGGLRVLRYGDTRAQLLGVEAVLGTGAVISHLSGLLKDNTGYHLASLLCGSEGTLGVVTAARLRLVAPAPERVVALLAFDSAGPAVAAAAALRRSVSDLAAAELFLAPGLALVRRVRGLAAPFPVEHGAYLLVESAATRDPTAELADAIEALRSVADVAVARDSVRAAELWRYREAHTEAINTEGPPHKLDVTLPAGTLAEFVDRVPAVVAAVAPGARCWLFGHAADGNVHVNVTGVDPDDDRVDGAVLELVAGYGGSISAEHGIGTAKRRWLALNRSPAEIEAFGAIKAALDPDGVLNPGVLLPDRR